MARAASSETEPVLARCVPARARAVPPTPRGSPRSVAVEPVAGTTGGKLLVLSAWQLLAAATAGTGVFAQLLADRCGGERRGRPRGGVRWRKGSRTVRHRKVNIPTSQSFAVYVLLSVHLPALLRPHPSRSTHAASCPAPAVA